MLLDFTRYIIQIPKIKTMCYSTCPPLSKDAVEVHRDYGIVGTLTIGNRKSND